MSTTLYTNVYILNDNFLFHFHICVIFILTLDSMKNITKYNSIILIPTIRINIYIHEYRRILNITNLNPNQ